MTLNLQMPEREDLKPRITVFGVGGAGGNAVNNMIEKQLEGVDFVVANTDAQALAQNRAPSRVQIGVKVTEGLGAGARPSVGAAAAEETIEEIIDQLAGAHMCFITAGMGGGTGTGAAPIIAQAARELGVLTVGVVTKPFQFEGVKRMRQAEEGVETLQKMVDTLIIIPNQNLFRLANEKTTFTEAFSLADDVLYQGVKGVTDLMVRPGLINLDFADVRAVMDEMGKAMMGTGEATGEDRAVQAAEKAIANPLLDEISLRGAKGVLINITGGHDLTLFELDEAANRIREEVDGEANIIVGSTLEDAMEGAMRVSVVATGIDAAEQAEAPAPRRPMAARTTPPAPTGGDDGGLDTDDEPSLFPGVEQESTAPVAQADDLIDEADVPPPAYRPVAQAHTFPSEPVQVEAAPVSDIDEYYSNRDAAEETAELPSYEEPQPQGNGGPSPEVLARLQAAVQRNPRPRPSSVAAPAPAPAADAEDAGEKTRFGINSLIGRMTGHGAEAPAAKAAPPVRRQPPVTAPEDELDLDPEQERIEIPAFLRRQAN